MKSNEHADKKLGIGSNITRRDFLNTTLIGVGGALLTASAPLLTSGMGLGQGLVSPAKDAWFGYGAIGDYAKACGNTRQVMDVAHRMRDGLYNDLSLAKDTAEHYDMVIVGGGMSGLGAAHFFKKNASAGQKCLILENHSMFGGVAKSNEFIVNGKHLTGPQGSNDFGIPGKGAQSLPGKLFDELNIPREFEYQKWDADLKPLAFGLDNYAHMTGVAE